MSIFGGAGMAKSILLLITSMLLLFGSPAAQEIDESALDHFAAYEEALASGGIEEALKEAKLAYEAARREWGRKDRRTGLMASNYGIALLLSGDNRGAKRIFSQCIAIFEAADDESADKAYCHYNLGIANENTGRETIAVQSYEDALVILEPLSKTDPEALALAAEVSLVQAKTAIKIDFKKPARYRSPQEFKRTQNERFSKLNDLTSRAERFNRDAFGDASTQYMDVLIQTAKVNARYHKLKTARDSYARAYVIGETLYAPDDPELESLFAQLLKADLANSAPNTMLIGSRDLSPDPGPIVEEDCARADVPKEKSRDACPITRWPPRYPNIRPYVSGFVVLTFDVKEDGSTANFRVVESKPDGRFEKAAIKAVEKWEYLPPVDENGAVYDRKDVETVMTFEIQGQTVPYRERYCFEFPLEGRVVSTCSVSRKLPFRPTNIGHVGNNGYALAHYDIMADGAVSNVRIVRSWPGGDTNQGYTRSGRNLGL